jgi:hypothetical protein
MGNSDIGQAAPEPLLRQTHEKAPLQRRLRGAGRLALPPHAHPKPAIAPLVPDRLRDGSVSFQINHIDEIALQIMMITL